MTFVCKELEKDKVAEMIDYARELGLSWSFEKTITLERSELLLKIHHELRKIIGEQMGIKPEEVVLDGYLPEESPRNYDISLLQVVGCRRTPFYTLGLDFDGKSGPEIVEFGFHLGSAQDREVKRNFVEVRNTKWVKKRERHDQLSDTYFVYVIDVLSKTDCLRGKTKTLQDSLYERLKQLSE